jgi:wyosine [tRNA(Phe)-imidazoG37] synthetase (radical SAM superfamily)
LKTIFGPIHSRRFGISLGIDLSPSHKQCNFDCLYCELAPAATVDHQEKVVAVDTIISELKSALLEHKNIDEITVTANGEPTLYPHLDALIKEIDRTKEDKKTLILTNSATLTDENVFNTLLKFDQVKLSLDAVTPDVFKKIDRPHPSLKIEDIVSAIERFSHAYRGRLFVEILFVRGLNDTKEEIAALNTVLKRMDAVRIDIGTIDRPPAYPVEGISYSELHDIATRFDADLPINIASRRHAESAQSSYTGEEIVNTLDKRPLTPDDIELLFDDSSKRRLQTLVDEKKIIKIERARLEFYIPAENAQRKHQKS